MSGCMVTLISFLGNGSGRGTSRFRSILILDSYKSPPTPHWGFCGPISSSVAEFSSQFGFLGVRTVWLWLFTSTDTCVLLASPIAGIQFFGHCWAITFLTLLSEKSHLVIYLLSYCLLSCCLKWKTLLDEEELTNVMFQWWHTLLIETYNGLASLIGNPVRTSTKIMDLFTLWPSNLTPGNSFYRFIITHWNEITAFHPTSNKV